MIDVGKIPACRSPSQISNNLYLRLYCRSGNDRVYFKDDAHLLTTPGIGLFQ